MADFQQRHYEQLATLMQDVRQATPPVGLDTFERMLADMLDRDSEKFDRARFLRACQPGRNVRAKT